jgi:translation initiation factor IF-1
MLKNITATQDFGKVSDKQDTIELTGKVIEALPSAQFRVQLESGQIILGYVSGRLRMYHIRILPGDKVLLEVTPYDVTRGRITRRL